MQALCGVRLRCICPRARGQGAQEARRAQADPVHSHHLGGPDAYAQGELVGILDPYCLDPADIFGRDDINNLLTHHADVDRQHFKLWLTSATVLERVLNAGIFSESDRHLERIRQRLCRYVPNPSLERAEAILEKSRFCIVAGIPGIGKTTLAQVLLTDLVDLQGFSAYRITHDLSELQAIKNPKSKQAFYFDDFLGKTALDKLQKNEEEPGQRRLDDKDALDVLRLLQATGADTLAGALVRLLGTDLTRGVNVKR